MDLSLALSLSLAIFLYFLLIIYINTMFIRVIFLVHTGIDQGIASVEKFRDISADIFCESEFAARVKMSVFDQWKRRFIHV